MAVPERSAWWRGLDAGLSLVGLIALATLLALLGGRLAGHQVLIDRSDSMRPAIAAGDLLVTRRIAPAMARSGDIVTFAEPGETGRSITHRVVSVREQGSRFAFVTKGDANSGSEHWTVDQAGSIGRTLIVIPGAGYVLDWLGRPLVRFLFITVASLLLGLILLVSIWRRETVHAPTRLT